MRTHLQSIFAARVFAVLGALFLINWNPTVRADSQTSEHPHEPSHLVFHERGKILGESQFSIGLASRLSRKVISLDRHTVLFPESGPVIRTSMGLGPLWEVRADFGWITQNESGHSGQFDLQLAAKRSLLNSGTVKGAAFVAIRGTKNMGFSPSYSSLLKMPFTFDIGPFETSVAPVLLRNLSGEAYCASALESAFKWQMHPELDLLVEAYYHPSDLNRKFTSFHETKGLAAWAGIRWKPLPRVRIPILLAVKPPDAGIFYGLVMASFQVVL